VKGAKRKRERSNKIKPHHQVDTLRSLPLRSKKYITKRVEKVWHSVEKPDEHYWRHLLKHPQGNKMELVFKAETNFVTIEHGKESFEVLGA